MQVSRTVSLHQSFFPIFQNQMSLSGLSKRKIFAVPLKTNSPSLWDIPEILSYWWYFLFFKTNDWYFMLESCIFQFSYSFAMCKYFCKTVLANLSSMNYAIFYDMFAKIYNCSSYIKNNHTSLVLELNAIRRASVITKYCICFTKPN